VDRTASAQRLRCPLPARSVRAEQIVHERVVAALGVAQAGDQRRRCGGDRLGGGQLCVADARVEQPHEADHPPLPPHGNGDPRRHAQLLRRCEPHGRRRAGEALRVEPRGEVGGRLAREDRREPHAIERLGVRGVREHAVAAILDRDGLAKPVRQRVDELLQVGHRRARYRCRIKSRFPSCLSGPSAP
jgi:hypothetical protein